MCIPQTVAKCRGKIKGLEGKLDSRLVDKSTAGTLTPSLSAADRTARTEISRNVEGFTTTIHQQALTDVYKTLHPARAADTFFSKFPENTDHDRSYSGL